MMTKELEDPVISKVHINNEKNFDNHYTHSCWHVLSNIIFVMASCFYLALSTTLLDSYRFYKDVPASVLYATDDETWLQYWITSNAFDDVYLNTTDDYTLGTSFNNSFYPYDDVVFQVNPAKPGTVVNQFMILYFIAAMGFLITGILEVCLARTCPRKGLYCIFISAAALGVASSMCVVANPNLSSIFNFVSVHLFAIEAIMILVRACQDKWEDEDNTWVLWTGHLSFVIGTVMDVVLSYFFVLEQATLPHIQAGIAASCFWLLASLIYLGNSIYQRRYQKRRHVQYIQHEDGNSNTDDNDTNYEKPNPNEEERSSVFEDEQSV